MNILIADDEELARRRLRQLLDDCKLPGVHIAAEAANANQAMAEMRRQKIDLVFLDIQMPGMSGMQLAQLLAQEANKPEIVFVTAHPEHALQAFDVSALDYLTKPVRLERLRQCLDKAMSAPTASAETQAFILIHDRHGVIRVPLDSILYFKAELKYITVRTATHQHLLEGSLQELEQQYPEQFLRVHRNALVSQRHLVGLLRAEGDNDDEGWQVQLGGIAERLAVSRRQLPAVKDALHKIGK
jgi:two-component system, LytTR family, response regulator AlgR